MKLFLTTLNAKYVHTSLGLWYIYQYCRPYYPDMIFKEYNINQDLAWVCGEIYREHADVIAISCNIWNVEQILILCKRIKQVAPKTLIVLGGPEVWERPEQMLTDNPDVDFIIVGEGEVAFKEWLDQYYSAVPQWNKVKGLVYRNGEEIIHTEDRTELPDLSVLPFPYPDDLTGFERKLIYYETTRGCPFHCQYCLSANEGGVRYFPMERVKNELLRFIKAGIRQVKLVDRSFNCNPKWAKEIWRFLIAHPGVTNFHFEIVGDLLDDESLAILKTAPKGMFQFEIGVQSTHPETLERIQRKMNWERLSEYIGRLVRETNVFVHLDLIAGLPEEDYDTFARTFNETLSLRPHRLQLGFLKLLRGSGLRAIAEQYHYVYTRETPYEVLQNQWMDYDHFLRLKIIEDLLERYYNSGWFKTTLAFLFARHLDPFSFFEAFAKWWKERGFDSVSHKSRDLYKYLLDFSESITQPKWIIQNLLKYDLLCQERTVEIPSWLGNDDRSLSKPGYAFWKDPANVSRYLPDYIGHPPRDIQRQVYFARFDLDPEMPSIGPDEGFRKETIILFIYRGKEVKTFKIDKEALING